MNIISEDKGQTNFYILKDLVCKRKKDIQVKIINASCELENLKKL